jgi:L-iditol 2-dehydrogenase
MQRTKAARYYGGGNIRIEEVDLPELRNGEVKVRVRACGICGSDLTDWYMEPRAPAFFGHEPSGDVVEVGPGVEEVKVGDRVFAHHHVPCFVCHYCRRGYYTLCETFKKTSLYPGGFAEYIVVPALNTERDTLRLPDSVSYEEATLIEPVGCCIKGIKRANLQLGDTVAVIGAGFMGLVHVQLARLFGAGRLFAVDSVPFRLQKAEDFGAHHTIDFKKERVPEKLRDLNHGRGADVVIVCTGHFDALREAMEIAEKGSTVYVYAPLPPDTPFPVDIYRFFFSEITLVTTYSASHLDTRAALALIAGGQIDAKNLLTHRFPLERTGEALSLAKKAQDSLKVVVTP